MIGDWRDLPAAQKHLLKTQLQTTLTPQRVQTIDRVCQSRTQFLQLAIEDLVANNNAGNVLRSCDCLGVQIVHLFGRYDMECVIGIAKGSHKWLTVKRYDATVPTIEHVRLLQQQQLQLIVTTPHNPTVTLDDFVPQVRSVLFFGSEVDGVSPALLSAADERLAIPLAGFCESLNVSTCAGIILYTLLSKIKAHTAAWQLDATQMLDLSIDMICYSLGERARQIVQQSLVMLERTNKKTSL